jgi:hypothetical protein
MLSRRSFVGVGLAGLAGCMGLPSLVSAAAKKARAGSVLVLFEQGGVSQMDTWDPKPEAPSDHRTPFKSIPTNVAGIQFSELLAKTAKLADKLAVVRCMTQPLPGIGNSHPLGSQYIFSGEAPGGPVEMPDMASSVNFKLGAKAK